MNDFFRHFRSFLGLPKFDEHSSAYHEPENRRENFADSRYDAFSDTLEMHRFFEQQVNKILGEFDIFQFGGNNPFFGELPGHGAIDFFDHNEDQSIIEDNQSDLRNQFLKPGFERPTQQHFLDKSDKEVKESEININDLDSVISGNYFENKRSHNNVATKVFGKSISTKTIINADGSMEIHKTINDNEGNEETTITKRIGDKEHTIIKKRDRSGKEEIIENLINIDQKDASRLIKSPDNESWSLFDRFFK